MSGKNTTGVHTVDDYQLGRGILQMAELDTAGHPKGFRDLGNVPELTASVESEKLEHFSSRSGLKQLDKTIILQITSGLSFVLEDINFENLAAFFSGTTADYTNPAIAGVTDARFVEDDDLEVNRSYILRTPTGPAFGITTVNSIVVESTNATPVAMVKDTDYTVNEVEGQIFVLDTATVQSIISAGDGLAVTLTADAAATTVDQLNILAATELNVALRFILEEADSGEKIIYDYHKCTVSADGDYALISDEWSQLPMTASVEENAAYPDVANSYYPTTQT